MRHTRSAMIAGTAGLALASLVLAGCTTQPPQGTTPPPQGTTQPSESPAPVVLRVGNMPPESTEGGRKAFEASVEAFKAEYPHIDIRPEETAFDPQTFSAQLAGGTLPTVIEVPFTEMGGLIALDQVKDITSWVTADPVLSGLSPTALAAVTDADGTVNGVPILAYTVGLIINRSVFEAAGLDPDTTPLGTWDEVRNAAVTITEKTDAAGFGQTTMDNLGGWVLTAMSYSRGERIQSTDTPAVSQLDNPATLKSLQWLSDLRWKDDAMGDNFLLGVVDLMQQTAAGDYGMMVGASDWYNPMTAAFGMDPAHFGLFPLPQGEGSLGTLGGGTAMIIRPDATDPEVEAALTWIKWLKLGKYFDKDTAVTDAKASAEANMPVPNVGLPLVDAAQHTQYLSWIDEHINVPFDQMQAYWDSAETLPIVTEPRVEAQQIYASLDPLLQKVLTQQDADIPASLAEVQATVSTIVAAAQ